MQTADDKYRRVQQIVVDEGGTWDLSKNDKDALRYVLSLVNSLAETVADSSGCTVGEVLRQHAGYIESQSS